MSAAGATVTADRDQQSRGSPPERFMSQRASHAVTYNAFFAAAAAPPILIGDPARQHGPIRVEALAGHLQPELVEAAESRQVSAGEARPTGSVRHVEVFQMDGVGTSIIGRPRPLSRHRRADDLYTLNCEEPDIFICSHRSILARSLTKRRRFYALDLTPNSTVGTPFLGSAISHFSSVIRPKPSVLSELAAACN
ncbi:hypothetical protein MSMEG_5377 [Mycolicibacterium smegmatis MC2 155]|uniref:Uncharacterized protein n=2 Tax=Mycolicibacterium smegmatis TaxID=1772 RepID=A0R382_MYCS2|nr:hypothetical protein MSMEG_5377 [Mycolicibacterium smegmatis MC2 155]